MLSCPIWLQQRKNTWFFVDLCVTTDKKRHKIFELFSFVSLHPSVLVLRIHFTSWHSFVFFSRLQFLCFKNKLISGCIRKDYYCCTNHHIVWCLNIDRMEVADIKRNKKEHWMELTCWEVQCAATNAKFLWVSRHKAQKNLSGLGQLQLLG